MTDKTESPTEIIAWMWQNEDTGNVGFVDQWQLDNGFEKANPRLKLIAPLCRCADKPEAAKPEVVAAAECLIRKIEQSFEEHSVPAYQAPYFAELEALKDALRADIAPLPAAPTDEQINEGLRKHRLKVDEPSQLSDSFRAGMKYAATLLSTAPQADQPVAQIPDTHCIVPKEATDEMIDAACDAVSDLYRVDAARAIEAAIATAQTQEGK